MDQTVSQQSPSNIASESRGTQLSIKRPSYRSVRLQVAPHTANKVCQADIKPKTRSIAVQCNILKTDVVKEKSVSAKEVEDEVNDASESFSEPLADMHDQSFYLDSDSDTYTDITSEDEDRNEVNSSSHMEKEGLARSVSLLQSHHVKINTIVTDRHVQIRKWVRENMVGTKHCVDVWHVAKGLKKKLLALSKEKDCSEILDWIKSITNHLYWVATSCPDANKDVMVPKWESLKNHIQNIHEGHGDHFPNCLHSELDDGTRKKRWFKPGPKSLEKLLSLLETRQMKMDIPMLSTNQQTSEIQGYHSVINHFAPKMYGFSSFHFWNEV